MTKDEKRRRDCTRKNCLLAKLNSPTGWSIEALVAYCQGRAYEVAEEAAIKTAGGNRATIEKRREALINGLIAMNEEIVECLKVLIEEGTDGA